MLRKMVLRHLPTLGPSQKAPARKKTKATTRKLTQKKALLLFGMSAELWGINKL